MQDLLPTWFMLHEKAEIYCIISGFKNQIIEES